MQIDHDARVLMWAPHARFPYQKDPEYVHTDIPWMTGFANWEDNGGLTADYDLQIMFPLQVRVPHNNKLVAGAAAEYDAEIGRCNALGGADAALPTVTWSKGAGHTASCKFVPEWGGDTSKPLKVCALASSYSSADTGIVQLDATVDCQSAVVQACMRSQPVKSLASGSGGGTSSTPNVAPWAAVSAAVGTGAERVWYRVRYSNNGDYEVQSSADAGATWKLLQAAPKRSAWEASTANFARGYSDLPLDVEFRLLAGRMSIRVGGDNAAQLLYEENRTDSEGLPIAAITAVRAEAEKALMLSVYAAPVWWRQAASYASPEIYIGFTSDAWLEPDVRWVGDTAGWSATLDEAESSLIGPTVRYKLAFAGPNDGTFKGTAYSFKTRAMRAINLQWAGQTHFTPAAPVEPAPDHISVSTVFNPDALQVNSAAYITFNSTRPRLLPTGEVGTWAQWALNYGQVAIEIHGTRSTVAGGVPPDQLLFTGYGNVRGEVSAAEGGALYSMSCADRIRQLRSVKFNMPWMDGWNVFYVMYYLAQLGGYAASEMEFIDSVPPSPYDDSVGPDGESAYFMPVGNGGCMLTRFSGMDVWEAMSRVAYSIGYMLFPNLAGRLVFRKFRLPSGVKRSFYETDRESALAGGGTEGCWEVRLSKDMETVRSDLTLIGVDSFSPVYNYIPTYHEDLEVIYNPRAFNHLGYRRGAAWLDVLFAEETFASTSADKLFRALRVPSLRLQLTTWFQPDIFPLDVVTLESSRLGTSGIRLLVLGVQHDIPKAGAASTTIGAMHYVPED